MTWKLCVFIIVICATLVVSCAKVEIDPTCTIVPYVHKVAAASSVSSDQTEDKERIDATSLFVEDNYVYVGVGKTLTIVDVADPANPTRVSKLLLPYNSEGSFIVGDYLFMSDNGWPSRLSIVAVGDPHNPRLMTCTEEIALSLTNASLIDNYIFTPFEGDGGLRVYEVTTETGITKLVEVASYQSYVPPKLGLSPQPYIIAAQPRLVTDVVTMEKYAYVTENQWGGNAFFGGRVQIFDASDPKTIKPVAVYDMPDDWSATGLFPDNNYLVIVNAGGGLWEGNYFISILDITSPEKPEEVSIVTGVEALLAIHDGFVYSVAFASSEGRPTVRVRNIIDPENIVQVDWEASEYGWVFPRPGKMTVVDHYAYFLYSGWLIIVDVTNPFIPHKVAVMSFP